MAISVDSGVLQNWANRATREPSQTGTASFLSALKSGNDRRKAEEAAAAAEAEDRRRWEAEFGLKKDKEDRLSTAAKVKTDAAIAKEERNKRLDDARIENLKARTEHTRGLNGLAAEAEAGRNRRADARVASDKEQADADRAIDDRIATLKENQNQMSPDQFNASMKAALEEKQANAELKRKRSEQIDTKHAEWKAEFDLKVEKFRAAEKRLDDKEAADADAFGLTEGNVQAMKLMDIIKGADKTGVTDVTAGLLADALGVDPNRLSDVKLTPPTTYSGPLDVGISYTLDKGKPEEYEGAETILEQLGSTGDDKDAIAYRQGVSGKQGAATSQLIADETLGRQKQGQDYKRITAMQNAYSEEPTSTEIRTAKISLSEQDSQFDKMGSRDQLVWTSDFVRITKAHIADGKSLRQAQGYALTDMRALQSGEEVSWLAGVFGMQSGKKDEDAMRREPEIELTDRLKTDLANYPALDLEKDVLPQVTKFCANDRECIDRIMASVTQ